MGRTSARDRLEALRLEAEIKEKERQAARAARETAKATGGGSKSRSSSSSGGGGGTAAPRRSLGKAADVRTRGRVKIVWHVCDPSGKEVKTFPYAQEKEARDEAAAMTASSGRTHYVSKAEVPFSA